MGEGKQGKESKRKAIDLNFLKVKTPALTNLGKESNKWEEYWLRKHKDAVCTEASSQQYLFALILANLIFYLNVLIQSPEDRKLSSVIDSLNLFIQLLLQLIKGQWNELLSCWGR